MNTEDKLGKIGLDKLVDNINKEINKKVNSVKEFGYSKEEIDVKVEPIGEEYIRNLFTKDGDPSSPIPYYTKEESDVKYSTKEESDAKYVNKSELGEVANTKYTTVNGVKEFDVACDGYVDNVLIEGETLVNKIIQTPSTWQTDNKRLVKINTSHTLVSGTDEFTAINVSNKNVSLNFLTPPNTWHTPELVIPANSSIKFTPPVSSQLGVISGYEWQGWTQADNLVFDKSLIILSGNYVGKQIPYFEGICSVGQGDKIEVLTYQNNNANKFDLSSVKWVENMHLNYTSEVVPINGYCYSETFIPIPDNQYDYLVLENANPNICFYDGDKNYIPHNLPWWINEGFLSIVYVPKNAKYFRFTIKLEKKGQEKVFFSKWDKKQIPNTFRSLPNGVRDILRGNVKTEKCGELILNPTLDITLQEVDSFKVFNIPCDLGSSKIFIICDKYKIVNSSGKEEGILYDFTNKRFRITTSKINTVDELKNELKNNPVTIVYELEKPIIIELPNFNPRTFKGKNIIVVNSGAIQCEAQYEVTNNLRSEVDVLKDKVDSAFQSGSSTKQNLADKLTSVGVPNVSASNTFAELIASIPMKGADVKIATGEIVSTSSTIQFTYLDNSNKIFYNYVPLQLDFDPDILIYLPKGSGTCFGIMHSIPWQYAPNGERCFMIKYGVNGGSGSSTQSKAFKCDSAIVLGNNLFNIPFMSANHSAVYLAIKYK